MVLMIPWTLRKVVSRNGLTSDPSAAYLNVLVLNMNSGTAPVINPTGNYYDIKLPFHSSFTMLYY